jgi:hypothetical protein
MRVNHGNRAPAANVTASGNHCFLSAKESDACSRALVDIEFSAYSRSLGDGTLPITAVVG